MRNQTIIFILFSFIIGVIFIHIFFIKDKAAFLTKVYDRAINDTISYVYSQKYHGGVVVATSLVSRDTVLIIDGVNDSLKIWFSSFSDKPPETWGGAHSGLLYKKAFSDSFYLKKDGKIIGFRLSRYSD